MTTNDELIKMTLPTAVITVGFDRFVVQKHPANKKQMCEKNAKSSISWKSQHRFFIFQPDTS